ncbi:MAG TPA: rhodanese-like domain-containing protein [Burkholderiales bacterium]
MHQITPQQLQEWLNDSARERPVLLDVREPWELELCSLSESLRIPMNTIPSRQQELEPARETVVICHHGGRSMQVASFLEQNGFTNVYNLSGGVDAWAREVDPTMATY